MEIRQQTLGEYFESIYFDLGEDEVFHLTKLKYEEYENYFL
ncbi:Uncharacterised protein [Sphingobacterium daejeonense]|nr:Uncharacterised protein [Sphingobacterium daejeonense]